MIIFKPPRQRITAEPVPGLELVSHDDALPALALRTFARRNDAGESIPMHLVLVEGEQGLSLALRDDNDVSEWDVSLRCTDNVARAVLRGDQLEPLMMRAHGREIIVDFAPPANMHPKLGSKGNGPKSKLKADDQTAYDVAAFDNAAFAQGVSLPVIGHMNQAMQHLSSAMALINGKV